jgi:predicted metalloprotease
MAIMAALGILVALVTGCSRIAGVGVPPGRSASPGAGSTSPGAAGTAGPSEAIGSLVDPDGAAGAASTPTSDHPRVGATDRRPLFADLGVDEAVAAAIADLDDFWGDELLKRFDISYTPPRPARPVQPGQGAPLRCGTKTIDPAAVTRNALYCPADDYVAWDATYLPDLARAAGPFSVALVVAHEWGHAVQQRTGWPGDPGVVELQADCYAGAWAAHADGDRNRRFRLSAGDLDSALAGYLRLQDGADLGGAQHGDHHGTAFDRIGAFEDGYRTTAARCATYRQHPPALIALPVTAQDRAGAQIAVDQLLTLALNNLDVFWAATFAAHGLTWRPLADPLAVRPDATGPVHCAGTPVDPADVERGAWLCASEEHVGINLAGLTRVATSLGDFAAVLVVAVPFADAAAAPLGGGDADCLAGAWAGAGPTGSDDATVQPLALSGSDLDEAVAGLLASSHHGGGVHRRSAFDRVDAFRRGYVGGVASCLAQGGG